MAALSSFARPCIRHFSAHRPRPDSRTERAVVMTCLAGGVVLPFVPPAMESSRQRNSTAASGKNYPPLCFHSR